MALYDQTANREQDYLVNRQEQGRNQDTQRSYRLNTPSVTVSPTGGQSGRGPEPQEQPDRSRQQFRARERQIRETRPVDFTVNTRPATQSIKADITRQSNEMMREAAESAPQVEEFLPDFQKALTGDQSAIQRTGQRLQQDYTPLEYKPIQQTAANQFTSFLGAPSRDAYQVELSRQRGGPFGLNALDAARLEASGLGQRAFQEARQELGSIYGELPEFRERFMADQARREAEYVSGVEALRNAIEAEEQAMMAQAMEEARLYGERDVTGDLEAIMNQVRAENAELAPYVGGIDFDPYIDRDLSFAESLSQEEADRYNILAELLGTNPVSRIDAAPALNRDAIINALIAEAQNELAGKQSREREQVAAVQRNRAQGTNIDRVPGPVTRPTSTVGDIVRETTTKNVLGELASRIPKEIVSSSVYKKPIDKIRGYF